MPDSGNPPWFRRTGTIVVTILIVALSIGAGILIHKFAGLLSLRIAAAPGPDGGRAATALAQVFAAYHPRIRVRTVSEPTLAGASTALDRGDGELGIVRSDAAGKEGQTLVILRRDAVLFLATAHGGVDGIGKLRGRTVGLLNDRPLDAALLDRVLKHFDVPKESVRHVPLGLDQVQDAVRHRRIDALFLLAPVASPSWRQLIAAFRKGTGSAPRTFGVDEAAAIANANPGLETLDIPKGALDGSLPAPDDDITTLSVSFRLVSRPSMPDWLAGEVTREVLMGKPRLVALDPELAIEAPDTDDNAPALPVHSGATAYLSGNLPSLSDQAQNALYWFGLVASAAVSLSAASVTIYRRVRPRRPPDRVTRLLEIWLAARSADAYDRTALGHEIDELVHATIVAEARGEAAASELRLVALVATHARQALHQTAPVEVDTS